MTRQTMQRDNTFSVLKAFGIILMVMVHAGCPSPLSRFANEMIMPLFFVAAGYFFSPKYLDDEVTFVKKRLKGLYVPFVKWSVVFLILHNLMFPAGLLSEQVGNATGGVTHPYSWHVFQQRLWNIVTAMSSYDEFLCGAYWFFRALLVASIAYLVLFRTGDILGQRLHRNWRPKTLPVALCGGSLLLVAWQTAEGLRVTTLVQGGYRDLLGLFFFSCGYMFHLFRDRYRVTVLATVLTGAVAWGFSVYAPSSMSYSATFEQFAKFPLPALCGTLMLYNLSWWIDKRNIAGKRFLVYCGNHTLYILLFHFVAFKLASLLKVLCYHLDMSQIAAFPVIQYKVQTDGFWLVYTLCGVGIPLLWIFFYQKIRKP